MLPPLRETTKASDNADFGAHSRSFRTCSPTLRVSCCHSRARLASGWLAGLYREGVEPSGSLRKVSDHMVIPLSCPPDATHVPYKSQIELRAAYMPDAPWAVSGHPPSLSREKGQPPVLTPPNPLSTLLQRFACARLSQSYLSKSCSDFSATFTTIAFALLHLSYSCAPPYGPAILVTQDPSRTSGQLVKHG